MNFSTTDSDFSILKNGIDANLEIIRHDETGYYNITKIANVINQIKYETDVGGIPPTSDYRSKRVKDWFRTESTKELVRVCERYVYLDDFEEVVYELKSNTPKKYTGTYVHRYLYDQFLNWLDVSYAIRISRLLDDIHQAANKKIIKEKEDKIDRLQADLNELRRDNKQQSAEIRELLGYAKETNKTLHEVQNDLTETKEEVVIAKSYLEEKSLTSTKNPSDESKHHYFGATLYLEGHDKVVKFLTGQKSYVDKTINDRVLKEGHEVIVKPFYNANGIDLRQNVSEEFKLRRSKIVSEINESNAMEDKIYNDNLKKEIRDHNKSNPDNKRLLANEKRRTQYVKTKDIPVVFKKLSFSYTPNDYISFKEVLKIIIDVNGITQESPLRSDEE